MVLQQEKQDQQQTLKSAVEKVIQRQSGKLNMTYAERVGIRSGVAALTNETHNNNPI